MRNFSVACIVFALSLLTACGGGNSSSQSAGNPASGNWQFTFFQPLPHNSTFGASGFLSRSSSDFSGSLEVPGFTKTNGEVLCGGVAPLTGSVMGQTLTLSLDQGGSTMSLTGTLSADGKSITGGSWEIPAGACTPNSQTGLTGTWSAAQIPSITGSFTGTIESSYLGQFNQGNAVPVSVTGSFTQYPSVGTGLATVTGNVTAVSPYPCFHMATLSGTISGQSVFLNVFDHTGAQIGTIGSAGGAPAPAIVSLDSSGKLQLTGSAGNGGLFLETGTGTNPTGPCPLLPNIQPSDQAGFVFTLQ